MEISKVDGLELGKLIGHGGCGRVYELEEERVAKVFVTARSPGGFWKK